MIVVRFSAKKAAKYVEPRWIPVWEQQQDIYWTNSVCCTFPSPATCYFLLKYNFFFLFVFSFDGEMRHGSVRAAQSDALEYVGIEKTHQQQIHN